MRALYGSLFATLTFTACALNSLGPNVDHDWCAKGHVNDEALVSDLKSRASTPATFASISYASAKPVPSLSYNPSAPGTPPESSFKSALVGLSIDMQAPVMVFPTGPSRVAGASIPQDGSPYMTLFLAPIAMGVTAIGKVDCDRDRGTGYVNVSRLIDPLVIFLDASKTPISGPLQGDDSHSEDKPAKKFSIPANARHFVVFYDSGKLMQQIELVGKDVTTTLATAGLFIPVTVNSSVKGVRTSTGLLRGKLER